MTTSVGYWARSGFGHPGRSPSRRPVAAEQRGDSPAAAEERRCEIALLVDSLSYGGHRERSWIEVLGQLVPPERRRDRRSGERADGIGGDDLLAVAVHLGVGVDAVAAVGGTVRGGAAVG